MEVAAQTKEKMYPQPFLLAVGQLKKPVQYLLILDKIVVLCGTNIIEAIDKLFKAHYVFNVHYLPAVLQLWDIMAAFIYDVTELKNSKTSSNFCSCIISECC